MKTKLSLIIIAAGLFTLPAMSQTDSVRTKTSVTTTTITTDQQSGTAQPQTEQVAPAPAPAPRAEAADDGNSSDFPRAYIGVRFMPTVTDFDVKSMDGAAKTSFVVAYGFGGYVGFNFTKHVGAQLEVIYSTLSQKYTADNRDRTVELSYLHFPLLLVLNTDVSKPVNFNVVLGPQIGINTGSKLSSSGSEGVDSVNAVLSVKPADLGFAYGAGLEFRMSPALSLGLGFRGVYGLLDISDNSKTTTTDQYLLLDRSHVKTYAGYLGLKLNF